MSLLCHVNLAHGYRGGERQTELLIRGLSAYVPRQRAVVRNGCPLLERLRGIPGVEVRSVSGRLSAVRATEGSALVHAHETGGAQSALLRHWRSGTPYVITRREIKVPKREPFTRAMYRRAAAVAALSDAIAASLAVHDPAVRAYKIPSAASVLTSDSKWVREFRTLFPGKFLVGHIAALNTAHKGQLTLIAAARLLRDSHPDLHFVLVGSGPDEKQILDAAAGLDNVTLTGWTDSVGDYLQAFDVFAFPSKHEGLGSVLIDAMQFGLPIVATRVGGIPELVEDGRNGLLVEKNDAAGLAAAIARLFSDQALRDAMSRANRLRAGEFQPHVMTQRYLELYAEIGFEFRSEVLA